MSNLRNYIMARPQKPISEWATDFRISRPHLHCLIDGSRNPSLTVAQRIAEATGGEVPIGSWPNLAAVLDAARGAA